MSEQRPTGIDPEETARFELSPYGFVELGWIPGLKWRSFRARQRKLLAEAEVRSKDDPKLRGLLDETVNRALKDMDLGDDPEQRKAAALAALAMENDPEYQEQEFLLDRELIRIAVVGWELDGLNPAQREEHRLPYGDTYMALTDGSLAEIDRADLVHHVALCAWSYYSMTAEEKKRFRSSSKPIQPTSTVSCAEPQEAPTPGA